RRARRLQRLARVRAAAPGQPGPGGAAAGLPVRLRPSAQLVLVGGGGSHPGVPPDHRERGVRRPAATGQLRERRRHPQLRPAGVVRRGRQQLPELLRRARAGRAALGRLPGSLVRGVHATRRHPARHDQPGRGLGRSAPMSTTAQTRTTEPPVATIPEPGRTRRSSARVAGWAFVAPFLVFFVMCLVWPMIHGVYLSFTDISLTGAGGAFVGLENYAEAFRDGDMWRSLGNTAWFTLLSTVPL